MKRIALLPLSLLLLAVGVSSLATAQAPTSKSMDMNSMDMKSAPAAKKGMLTTHSGVGVVTSVDPTSASITFAHDPIKSLNWPAMTMGFKVEDKALLDRVKPGDKVTFTLAQSGKDYVITSIK